MHRRQLREIIRDVDIISAITLILRKHHLSVEATTDLLTKLSNPLAKTSRRNPPDKRTGIPRALKSSALS